MSTSARVTVTLELTGLGSWGDDCSLSQVYKQAAEAAVGRINRAMTDMGALTGARLVGEPVVTAVTTTEMRK